MNVATTHPDVREYLASQRARIERTLDRFLPPVSAEPAVIHEAMRYAVFAGGKRLRPILAIAAAEACGDGQVRNDG